jgi:ABC-type bacteriocin/lantibiotic exporter with double-glycine peptidase domain
VLPAEGFYLQTDARWANERIGGSGETLRAVGCTVCCLSMALAQHGVALDPSALNQRLKEADGFTAQGWLKWGAVRTATEGKVHVRVPDEATEADVAAALQAGNPVLVKVALGNGVLHWVLVVGREGREYLVKDPLGDGRSLKLLSSFQSEILAVRVVEKP